MAAKKKAKTEVPQVGEPGETSPPALRIGHLQTVKNLWRTFGSAQYYIRVRVQNDDGSEETLLFTEDAILDARKRVERNPEDVAQAPLLVDLTD